MSALEDAKKAYAKLSAEEQRKFRETLSVPEPELKEAPRRPGHFIAYEPGPISRTEES